MTLLELEHALTRARFRGAKDASPVIIETTFEDDDVMLCEGDLIQSRPFAVKVESRCEDGAPGVYIDLAEITIG